MTARPNHSSISQSQNLFDTVISGGYCVGCGACAAVAESPLRMDMGADGTYVPAHIPSPGNGNVPVGNVCPFYDHGVTEDELVPGHLRDGADHHQDIGWYRSIFAGHVAESAYRERGSSGGITSWLAGELLASGKVDGIIHVKATRSVMPGETLFEYGVSFDLDEVSRGAKSRYYPVEMSKAVELIRSHPGRYAFIGVPCFVKAMRLLARTDAAIAESIKYFIAIFCGHLKSTAFAEHAAWQLGIPPGSLVNFDFRTKTPDQPANRYSVTATGIVDGVEVTKTAPTESLLGSDWGQGFFKLKGCDYCDDIVGETADVSIGDAWLPQYVRDSQGTNVVIARNAELAELFHSAALSGRIAADSLGVEDVHRSQDSNFRHRRDGLAYRLWLADTNGEWRPTKRIQPDASKVSEKRKRVLDLRILLREATHQLFHVARMAGRVGLFSDLMAPLLGQYRNAVSAERSERNNGVAANPVRRNLSGDLEARVTYYKQRILAQAVKSTRHLSAPRNSALILPPTSPGGIGDDAMFGATINTLRKLGFQKIGMVNYDPRCPLKYTDAADELLNMSGYFSPRKTTNPLYFLRHNRGFEHFFVIGADVLDGYYSDVESEKRLMLAYWAAKSGMKTTVLGFSYNDSPMPRARDAMAKLSKDVRICARDPVSFKRLSGVLDHPPIQTADVAFLLEPAAPSDPALTQWLRAARQDGAEIIGINAIFTSIFFSDKSEKSHSNYVQFYLDLINAISRRRPNSRFVFIPHDYRPGGIGEGPLLELLYYSCPESVRDRIYLLNGRYSAAQIKWLCGELDFVVASRMHLAIAAVGQCTPVFCFGYQGKFEGLFELLGMPELLLSMENTLENRERSINEILALMDRTDIIGRNIREKLPGILELSLVNFNGRSGDTGA